MRPINSISLPLVFVAFSCMALASNHDMISKVNHIMVPDAKKAPKPIISVQALAPANQVTAFSLPGCPPCLKMKEEIKGNKEYDFKINEDTETWPDWIYDETSKRGWSLPIMYWNSGDDGWKFSMWGGLDHFRKQFPQKPKAISEVRVQYAIEAASTPSKEVERVLGLLPKPKIGFVDFGCGDARWCIAAAERWGVRVTGIEIDPTRVSVAKERVKSLGLSHLITIVEGDVTTTQVEADVGVAYLYADVLEQLRPRIVKLRAFASYMHRPPGLPVVQNGDSWFYTQATNQIMYQSKSAVWQGQSYSQPVCNNSGCRMCDSIRSQLSRGSR